MENGGKSSVFFPLLEEQHGEKMRENGSSRSGSRWCMEDGENMESGGVGVYILFSLFNTRCKDSLQIYYFFRNFLSKYYW